MKQMSGMLHECSRCIIWTPRLFRPILPSQPFKVVQAFDTYNDSKYKLNFRIFSARIWTGKKSPKKMMEDQGFYSEEHTVK